MYSRNEIFKYLIIDATIAPTDINVLNKKSRILRKIISQNCTR